MSLRLHLLAAGLLRPAEPLCYQFGNPVCGDRRASPARLFASRLPRHGQRLAAQSDAEIQRLRTEAEIRRLQERERTASAYARHPALLRILELEALSELARNGNARIYIGFEKHAVAKAAANGG